MSRPLSTHRRCTAGRACPGRRGGPAAARRRPGQRHARRVDLVYGKEPALDQVLLDLAAPPGLHLCPHRLGHRLVRSGGRHVWADDRAAVGVPGELKVDGRAEPAVPIFITRTLATVVLARALAALAFLSFLACAPACSA